jgi:hypothetical protein
MRFSRSLPAAFAAVLLAAAAVHGPILRAAPSGEENPTPPVLKTSVGSSPSPLVSPGEGVLHLSIGIPTGYHLFGGAQLKASLEEAGGLAASPPRYPKGTVEEGQEVLRGNVVVDIPVRVAGGLAAKVSGNILLDWQGCQDFGAKVCFLPTRTSVPFTVKVAAAAAEAAPPKPETPPAADLAPTR